MKSKHSQNRRDSSSFMRVVKAGWEALGSICSIEFLAMFLFFPTLTLILIASGQHSAVYE